MGQAVKLFATGARESRIEGCQLLEVINAVKPAVGGDMGQAVKLFATGGFRICIEGCQEALRSSMR